MEDYLSNESRANADYKGKWATINASPVSRVESGSEVLVDYRWYFSLPVQAQMKFKREEDTYDIREGSSVTAVCKIKGITLNTWLRFDHCEHPKAES